MTTVIPSDRMILDLLRRDDQMTVVEFEAALGVTATAVRQRLNRLLDKGYIEKRKDPTATGRGRPNHRYELTHAGRRKTGSNFSDLAMALWHEVRAIKDAEVRRGLLQRMSARLADSYRDRIEGDTPVDRMDSLAALFCERQIPFAVEPRGGELPVLTALACPYPDLAEQDRTVCAMERMMVSDVLGERVTLDECRLDGDQCCTFVLSGSTSSSETSPSETSPSETSPSETSPSETSSSETSSSETSSSETSSSDTPLP